MDDLSLLLTRFVSGEDTSLATADSLEVLLDEAYPDDEVVQNAVIALASYRPGGGPFLFDTSEIQRRLLRLRDYLSRRT
ncbi:MULTISPECIES: hypothetical protein [Mesorhizobium]|uniref:Uncharacterized protein n=3 Tax=Mesorhizobium TaxID=68287 RepID=A0A1A5HUV9_RHILI|nr:MULTISPECIES: hypothetical protein [Mesorhizobium]MBE1710808.1 hypothetical protein [Mesorhizobium japonicum]MBE1715670.1 hypothetical protein [Mesorhizobium japonicum]MUT23112.1 hypothetical protein [Mesorhizobium japonicum]MUT30122.1 hypothetical protein [Mesorhizobium japonicum]OBP68438.1 hypothetical protein BAE42_23200 [Mesorhizobium loti]